MTKMIIGRNLWSAWLHGSGIYLYDMSGPSWGTYASAENRTSTAMIWGNVTAQTKLLHRLAALPPQPGLRHSKMTLLNSKFDELSDEILMNIATF